MSYWTEWEISEREMMEAANAAIFYNRPDLQFKFDGSAPPLIPAPLAVIETRKGGDAQQGSVADEGAISSEIQHREATVREEGEV